MRPCPGNLLSASLGTLALVLATACSGSGGTSSNSVPPPGAWSTMSVLAGVPSGYGYVDGTGANARFLGTYGVSLDGNGNLFVADGQTLLRKVTSAGVVTILPSRGVGFQNTAATAEDASGNVYVADHDAGKVFQLTAASAYTTVNTLAAPLGGYTAPSSVDAPGTVPGPLPAALLFPQGIALDPATGAMYIAVQDAIMKVH